MNYAIIDVETTGSSYQYGKITEIAIIIHDGQEIIDRFSTLINPEQKIPWRITQITGINNRMVEHAPKFYEVAARIVQMTEDCVFVAHNVNFDYNFLRYEFKRLGYEFQRERLCTVRLSRKLIPNLPSYSLSSLCERLNIPNPSPHRALGDAEATAKLFSILLSIEPNPLGLPLQGLQSNIDQKTLMQLPESPGVYYFLDAQQNIIYIGKSKNIRARVLSHLNNCSTRRAIEMRNKIASVDYELTGNELIALLLEAHEIQKHKPLYNRAHRRALFQYGLFTLTDPEGYLRLSIQKIDDPDREPPVTTFETYPGAREFLFRVCEEYSLCQKLCGLYESKSSCFQFKLGECKGACIGMETPETYNQRVEKFLERYRFPENNFLIIGEGRDENEYSVVRIENNCYIGFGFASKEVNGYDVYEYFSGCVKKYPDNRHIHSIIRSYLEHHPDIKILALKNQ